MCLWSTFSERFSHFKCCKAFNKIAKQICSRLASVCWCVYVCQCWVTCLWEFTFLLNSIRLVIAKLTVHFFGYEFILVQLKNRCELRETRHIKIMSRVNLNWVHSLVKSFSTDIADNKPNLNDFQCALPLLIMSQMKISIACFSAPCSTRVRETIALLSAFCYLSGILNTYLKHLYHGALLWQPTCPAPTLSLSVSVMPACHANFA